MAQLAAAVSCLVLAAAGAYALCRHLSCAKMPGLFGAAAFAFSDALLTPGMSTLESAVPSVLVPFALAGAFSRERRRWPFLALALVCLTLRWRLSVVGGELEALVLAVLAALGAQRLWDGEGGAAFLVGAAAAAFAAARGSNGGTTAVLVEALPVAAALVLAAAMSRETRARAGVAALVALFAVQRALEISLGVPAGGRAVSTAARDPLLRP